MGRFRCALVSSGIGMTRTLDVRLAIVPIALPGARNLGRKRGRCYSPREVTFLLRNIPPLRSGTPACRALSEHKRPFTKHLDSRYVWLQSNDTDR